jgi:hypothetical protein
MWHVEQKKKKERKKGEWQFMDNFKIVLCVTETRDIVEAFKVFEETLLHVGKIYCYLKYVNI